MTSPYSCLVVGCGAIGSGYDEARLSGVPLTHAGAYAAHPDTHLIGGVDPAESARARFERRWNVPCSSDLDAALAARPAFVSVCTPPPVRLSLVERILEAEPRAIWCEKPLAETSAEAEEIRMRCEEEGVALQVNIHRRFDPLHRRIASLVRAGAPPVHFDLRYSGTLRNYGPHAFDLFRWLVGEPVWAVAVALSDREPMALLGTERGATGAFHHVKAGALELFECDLFTADRRISLAAFGERALFGATRPSELWPDTRVLDLDGPEAEQGLGPAMLSGVQSLLDNLRDGSPLGCDGRDGVAAVRIVEAVERSAREGRRVPIEMTP